MTLNIFFSKILYLQSMSSKCHIHCFLNIHYCISKRKLIVVFLCTGILFWMISHLDIAWNIKNIRLKTCRFEKNYIELVPNLLYIQHMSKDGNFDNKYKLCIYGFLHNHQISAGQTYWLNIKRVIAPIEWLIPHPIVDKEAIIIMTFS